MEEFKLGDFVELNSGSQLLNVIGFAGSPSGIEVLVQWLDDVGHSCEALIPQESLKRVCPTIN